MNQQDFSFSSISGLLPRILLDLCFKDTVCFPKSVFGGLPVLQHANRLIYKQKVSLIQITFENHLVNKDSSLWDFS